VFPLERLSPPNLHHPGTQARFEMHGSACFSKNPLSSQMSYAMQEICSRQEISPWPQKPHILSSIGELRVVLNSTELTQYHNCKVHTTSKVCGLGAVITSQRFATCTCERSVEVESQSCSRRPTLLLYSQLVPEWHDFLKRLCNFYRSLFPYLPALSFVNTKIPPSASLSCSLYEYATLTQRQSHSRATHPSWP
jgi:hypothetical protein